MKKVPLAPFSMIKSVDFVLLYAILLQELLGTANERFDSKRQALYQQERQQRA